MNGNGIAQQALIFKGCKWIYFSNFSAWWLVFRGHYITMFLGRDQRIAMANSMAIDGNFQGFPYKNSD